MNGGKVSDDFDLFVRQTRRALRDVVRAQGQLPPKVDVVSRGSNPRRLEIQTVTTVEHRPHDRIADHIRRWDAAYVGLIRRAAYVVPPQGEGDTCPACGAEADDEEIGECDVCGGMGTLWRAVILTAFSTSRTATYVTGVHPVHGVGAWQEQEFRRGDIEGLRAILFDIWAAA